MLDRVDSETDKYDRVLQSARMKDEKSRQNVVLVSFYARFMMIMIVSGSRASTAAFNCTRGYGNDCDKGRRVRTDPHKGMPASSCDLPVNIPVYGIDSKMSLDEFLGLWRSENSQS